MGHGAWATPWLRSRRKRPDGYHHLVRRSDQENLEKFINAGHACIAIQTLEEEHALHLVRHAAVGRGLWLWSVVDGIRDGLIADLPPIPETEHPAAALLYWTRLAGDGQDRICAALDLSGHLRDERTTRALRELIQVFRRNKRQLVLIDHRDELPVVIAESANRFEISLPKEEELEELLLSTLREMNRDRKIDISISRSGLNSIVRNLQGLTRTQAEQVIVDTVAEDRRLNSEDIHTVLAHKRRSLQRDGLLEYIEAPSDASEIGGMKRLKQWLRHRQYALTDKAIEFGLTAPRGILLLGVQGAGKSLCAKGIAAAWKRPLLRMDPAALYDRYVGESERRLRDTLRQAESMAPIILWIDEIEKAFASAASRSTDGGLSQRMFGTLLTWMQEHLAPVFVVATANDIEALPPELLRKGRFDEIFFVDLPNRSTRETIFSIHLKRRKRNAKAFNLRALAEASEGYSGAEIEQAIIAGLHEAFAGESELTTELLLGTLKASPPLSVTMSERVQCLRAWAEGRCVPAD